MKLNPISIGAAALTIIGALNWGSIALFDLNLVRSLFRTSRGIERAIYGLVGLSGLLLAISLVQPTKTSGMKHRVREL